MLFRSKADDSDGKDGADNKDARGKSNGSERPQDAKKVRETSKRQC